MEFVQNNANVAGATASTVIQQLDPSMKSQWEKITQDFPKLFAFLTELNKVSKGNWKISPAQFTTLLNKHIVGAAGSLGVGQTAPTTAR